MTLVSEPTILQTLLFVWCFELSMTLMVKEPLFLWLEMLFFVFMGWFSSFFYGLYNLFMSLVQISYPDIISTIDPRSRLILECFVTNIIMRNRCIAANNKFFDSFIHGNLYLKRVSFGLRLNVRNLWIIMERMFTLFFISQTEMRNQSSKAS